MAVINTMVFPRWRDWERFAGSSIDCHDRMSCLVSQLSEEIGNILDESDWMSYPDFRHSVSKRLRSMMARTSQDVTEAELAVLEALWTRGPATIRQLTEAIYAEVGTSQYATVQKLLDRLETKGCVSRNRAEGIHTFIATINREVLIGRRLKDVADKLCGGSLTPLLTHLVQTESLSEQDRAMLRSLIEKHGSES
jgi:predicted transcriptional regulator